MIRSRSQRWSTTIDALPAEHGVAALVSVAVNGREHRVLFDAGMTPRGVAENMRKMDLSPKDVEAIGLSHGHFDHTTGLDGLAEELGRANFPALIHPEFWSSRTASVHVTSCSG